PKINANETSSSVAVWQLLPPADATALAGNYIFRSVAGKLALSVAADSTAPGAAVVQQADPPGASAVWTLAPTSGGYYQIKNAKSGLVMAVAGASVQAGAKIVQRVAQGMNPGDDQWWPVKNADGAYSFFNRNSQQALDDPALATEPDTQYDQWFGNSSYAQQFNLIPQK
ncbi:MAG: RICIN domain-containing protein, partial [Armatimonadota bacterium]|nr:RICIN domain-containing protein [Armatimonadota bacterium]